MPESAHSYPQFRPSGESSRNYFHHAPVGSRHQQERLCTDAVRRPIEICEQQPGELQPRLIDDMATLRSPTNNFRVKLLPGAPSELTPRPRRSEDVRVRVDERNRRHTDVRGCPEPHHKRRSGPRPRSHANRYRSTASALACMPEASHSPTRMPRRHIRVSDRFKFESRWKLPVRI